MSTREHPFEAERPTEAPRPRSQPSEPRPAPPASSPTPRVLLDLEGPVLRLTLNRPERHNAYDLAMRDALFDALAVAADHPDVGAVVLCGAGPSFCSGADLREFGTAPSQAIARRSRFARDVWGRLLDCPRPVVVALHGYCLGSGLEMALLCDLRIAARSAILGLPEIGLGMIPAAGGTQSAPRAAGLSVGVALLLTGERIDAPTALRYRLVDEVVGEDEVLPRAMAVAERLATLPQPAAAATRDALRRAVDLPLAVGLRVERRLATFVWEPG